MYNTNSYRRLSVLVLAALVVITLGICGTFALYMSEKDITGTTNAATWEVTVEGTDSTDTTTLALVPDTFENVQTATMAPGTTGSFQVKVTNGGQVDLAYTLTFVVTGDFANNANIKFYSDAARSTELTSATAEGTTTYTVPGTTQLDFGGASETVTVYWSWDWDADTDETEYAGKAFTVEATVDAKQVQPTAN